ncbi:MAG: transposase [Acidobacteriota bacterium]|nr:transposase [Acidobacteriota bacterium]
MLSLSEAFERLPDHRRRNASYPLADILRSACAMFSLKSPSLLAFREQTRHERRNLRAIYHITDIPGDTQMRAALDPVAPAPLRALFAMLFAILQQAGVVREYFYWHARVIVALDGVEHFSSTKVHCDHCTTRTHRDGTTSYHHAGLAAVMLHPDHEEVFPLDFEPILNPDGATKNDCERTAAKRLCAALHEQYPDLGILLVEDALYANAPHLRQITGYGWSYVLNVKPDSHPSLVRQFAGRLASGQVSELRRTDGVGIKHYFAWTSGLCLCDSAVDVRVNYLLYEQTDTKGHVTRWTWITNLPLLARTVERVMRAGRSRWQIENETFNTLKNQGYHFEHNYGHGTQNLATVLAVLMFLAFAVDQIQQRCWVLFRQVRAGLRTKVKVWESLRSLFKVLLFRTMEALYRRMASLYDIQLQ